jgi:hypothetical protein
MNPIIWLPTPPLRHRKRPAPPLPPVQDIQLLAPANGLVSTATEPPLDFVATLRALMERAAAAQQESECDKLTKSRKLS